MAKQSAYFGGKVKERGRIGSSSTTLGWVFPLPIRGDKNKGKISRKKSGFNDDNSAFNDKK